MSDFPRKSQNSRILQPFHACLNRMIAPGGALAGLRLSHGRCALLAPQRL